MLFAFQIADQFAVQGAPLNIGTAAIVGVMDMMAQAIELERRPHIVVATPGRMVDQYLRSASGDWCLRRVSFRCVPPMLSDVLYFTLLLTGGRSGPHTDILVRPCGVIPCPAGATPDLAVHRYHNQFD